METIWISYNNYQVNKLKKIYFMLAGPINNSNYCLFFLQLQPERTTLPLAEDFENQYLAIKMISEALPKNMCLYVKEHPRQFDTNRLNLNRRHFRDLLFYEDLMKLKNVKLLHLDANNTDVISNASYIFTGTGSVGWEALCLGVPVGIFGYAWYSGCAMCFTLASCEDILSMLEECRLLSKDKVIDEVYKYFHFIYNTAVCSMNELKFVEMSTLPYTEHLQNLSCRMCDEIEKLRWKSQ